MKKQQIKQLIEATLGGDGILSLPVHGVQLFRVTDAVHCAPAMYEPTVVAILGGAKEIVVDGVRHEFDQSRYLCCAMSMPLESGSPSASVDNPLIGVSISLDTRMMTELAIEMENAAGAIRQPKGGPLPQGVAAACWDEPFAEALFRLLQLADNSADAAVLAKGRLRELYYAILKGEAGDSARRAFGVGNEIARAIEYLSDRLDKAITIDDMASQVGMSRAVFHRKFKQATTMSPIQFIKSMRLNSAALKMVEGKNVNEAAMEVGYVSASQFSREFKRMYGQSPRDWCDSQQLPSGFL